METATASSIIITPGQLVTVWVRSYPNPEPYTGIVYRNRPDIDLDITEDGRTCSGWSWNIIERVEVMR